MPVLDLQTHSLEYIKPYGTAEQVDRRHTKQGLQTRSATALMNTRNCRNILPNPGIIQAFISQKANKLPEI